jgi:hypothetical protein
MSGPLSSTAYALCEEIRDKGAFAEAIGHVHNQQPAGCPEVIGELQRRCPGYTTEEYQAAIARGMFETR